MKPVAFADALKDWKAASGWNAKGCEQLPAGAPELAGCPRPIIVAGEGGGSRAAFLLASLLGALEDDSLDKQKNPTARPFHQQLFAISSVSGSSVGAAFFVSALKAQPKQTVAELKKALYKQRLWFPNLVAAAKQWSGPDTGEGHKEFSDRFCLIQGRSAGGVIERLCFSDPDCVFRAGCLAGLDVSAVSWIAPASSKWRGRMRLTMSTGPQEKRHPYPGLCRRWRQARISWTPLLFMNATSIGTGRRVMLTPIKIADPMGTGRSMLFPDTYDFHELLCAPYPDPMTKAYPDLSPLQWVASIIPSLFSPVTTCADRKPVSIDVRLSTAAGVSARSPFVSPHANVRDRRSQLTDSVVDGGYFDNSGIVTALDIAHGIKALDARLCLLYCRFQATQPGLRRQKIAPCRRFTRPAPKFQIQTISGPWAPYRTPSR